MFALKHCLSLILICFISNFTSAQSWSTWEGHIDFGNGNYSDAIAHYQAAIDSGSTWDWLPDLQVAAQDKINLGIINPSDTHKVAFIFVNELNIYSDTAGLTTLTDVTDSQKATWEVNFKLLKEVTEALSQGNWTIQYDTISATSHYTDTATLKPDNPDHLDLEDWFFTTMNQYDSYITFSNTRSPAMGLARKYPYIHGEVYGPDRGMCAINAGSHGFSVLFHEFFHVIEWVSNAITVSHGFEPANWSNFPDWTPGSELNYYSYHFHDTLTSVGWTRFNHRTRWVPFYPDTPAQDSLHTIYNTISLTDRQEADTLDQLAGPLAGSNIDSAAVLWNMALNLSPFHYESLYELVDYYRFDSVDAVKADEITQKLRLIRAFGDFYVVDTINQDYGNVIGLWHREDITESYEFYDLDITQFVQSEGCQHFYFYYTDGWQALQIDSVQLLENGVMIDMDPHYGFSGTNKTDIHYLLDLPNYNSGATYTLRAKIKGSNGTDSKGQIHYRVTNDCNVSLVEKKSSFLLYPNPTNTKVYFKTSLNNISWKLYDLYGRLIQRGNEKVIDMINLPAGVYVIYINDHQQKIIKH